MKPIFIFFILLTFVCCADHTPEQKIAASSVVTPVSINNSNFDTAIKTVHVFVALCDNKYQGIVPVPAAIGNGQDPKNNLYWGCGFGVKTFFSKSNEWTLLQSRSIDTVKMERLIFKNKQHNWYLVADAYNGKYIKQATIDLLQSAAGMWKDTLVVKDKTIGICGNAKLVAFIGHDGLMDFQLPSAYKNTDNQQRDAIILACISKKYFSPHLKATNARPLVWSTGLMSPEAYTLHDAVSAYIKQQSPDQIRNAAADAYAKYQHCSKKAALGLLVSGY